MANATTPMEYLQKCLSWMGQSESSVLQNGAVLNSEVDLRQYGLTLLRHYIWLEGNAGYFAQTSDGIVINSKCSLPISGIKEGYLQADSFKNKNEFDTLAEEIRQLSYSLGGKLEYLNEIVGIRTISYGFILLVSRKFSS
jgi:hypothetical protein